MRLSGLPLPRRSIHAAPGKVFWRNFVADMTNRYINSRGREQWYVVFAALLMLLRVSAVRGEGIYGVTSNGIFKVDAISGAFNGAPTPW